MKRTQRPNYEKMYPTASSEVIAYLKMSDRQMEYQSYDLKVERYKVDQEKQAVTFVPSREDSLERLMSHDAQFAIQAEAVEDVVIRSMMIAKLHKALELLSTDELALVHALFFEEKTEAQCMEQFAITQQAISKRKCKVLAKIKKILEN